MSAERLATMANQIGQFFAHRGERAPEAVAKHIRAFWDPRMREQALKLLAEGGAGLDPPARAALELLRNEASPGVPPAASG